MPSTSRYYCSGIFLMAASASVVAASEHRDNPNFKTRLGVPCFAIDLGKLDCDQFGLLGMTDQEVQELKDNCPCACNTDINCGEGEEEKEEARGTKPSPLLKGAADNGYTIHEASIDETEKAPATSEPTSTSPPSKNPASVVAASEHRDNPNFKTRLGVPCFAIDLGKLDCDQFGLLGMTDQEVQELKDNCPCACNTDINCGEGEEEKEEARGTKPSPLLKGAADNGYTIHEASIDETEKAPATSEPTSTSPPSKNPASVVAASEHRDNPNFKTRLGVPCFAIDLGKLDCDQFGLLGMTDQEVQELKDNCPCACNTDINCGEGEGEEEKEETHGTKPSPLLKGAADDDSNTIHEANVDETEKAPATSESAPTSPPSKTPATSEPTSPPSKAPATSEPTSPPSKAPVTSEPTSPPSKAPMISEPTKFPPSTEDQQTTENTASVSSLNKVPTFLPTAAPTFLPTSAPTTNRPTLRPNPSLNKGEETKEKETVDVTEVSDEKKEEASLAPTAPEASTAPAAPMAPEAPEQDVVDLLPKKTTMDEQPATTSSSIISPSPTPEADEDTMFIPYNFDENFSALTRTADNNDSLSKTAVIFIVFAALIVVAFAAHHFYKKYGGDASSNKALDKSEIYNSYGDSDGTVSEDGSIANTQSDESENPAAKIASAGGAEGILA